MVAVVRSEAPGEDDPVRPGASRDVARVAIDATTEQVREAIAGALDGRFITDDDAPDLVIAGVQAEAGDMGVRVRAAAARAGDRPVLVVADSDDLRLVREALGAGALGYVLADRMTLHLPTAIEAALSGQVVAPVALRRQFMDPLLSNREKQVLAMLVLGLSNQEIARRLVVTESTVKSQLTAAYRKLGVRSRKEAAAAILREDGTGTGILRIGAED